MRGFVLAAGFGTRLRPLTDLLPKPMVVVGEVPLVERAVRQLAAAGVTEIGINLFHKPEVIQRHLGDGSRLGVQLTWFDERELLPGEPPGRRSPLGTGGGLKNAEAFLKGGGDAFVLVNGDAWHGFSIEDLIANHSADRQATLAVHRDRRRPELHLIECGDNQAIAGISARPPMSVEELPLHDGGFRAIYTGVAVYSSQLLERLPAGKVSGLVTHAIAPALRRGERLCWAEPEGLWVDCGTIDEVLRADVYARSMALIGE